jgi:hypothetical protein
VVKSHLLPSDQYRYENYVTTIYIYGHKSLILCLPENSIRNFGFLEVHEHCLIVLSFSSSTLVRLSEGIRRNSRVSEKLLTFVYSHPPNLGCLRLLNHFIRSKPPGLVAASFIRNPKKLHTLETKNTSNKNSDTNISYTEPTGYTELLLPLYTVKRI